MLAHFAISPESADKVSAEFDHVVGTSFDELNIESGSELTYLSQVITEAIRWNPTAPTTSSYWFEKDTKIGNFTVKAYTAILINLYGLHRNSAQWQRPYEFLPQRFDPENELYLTPSGKKRHSCAYLPFNGGKRVCFGKTFAETVLRTICAMMAKEYKFSQCKEKPMQEVPMIMLDQGHYPTLEVMLTKRD